MEKEEEKWVQEEEEEEEKEEETLRGRLRRNKITSTVDSGGSDVNLKEIICMEGGDVVNGGTSIIMAMPSLDPSECESNLTQEEEQQAPLEEELKKTTTTYNTITATTDAVIENVVNGVPKENGQQQDPQKCVYYDHDEGIWKCQICCWTYQSGSVSIDHSQNPKWHLHMPMNDKNVNLRGPFFNCKTEGIEFKDEYSGIEHSISDCSGPEKSPGDDELNVTVQNFNIQDSATLLINHQYEENLKNDNLPASSIWPSEISSEEHKTSFDFSSNKAIKNPDINLIDESDLELSELDVERVIEKQNIHDLYCPNCNSCITRRVILRKRKRKIRIADDSTKRNKLEATVDSGLDGISARASNDQGQNLVDISGSQTPAANEYHHDREPEIFRCLSCFHFFIPTGNCFKLFQIFGDKSDNESIQDSQQIPPKNRNWFSSLFASDKRKMFIETGSHLGEIEEDNNVGAHISSSNLIGQNDQVSLVSEAPSTAHAIVVGGIIEKSTKLHDSRDEIFRSSSQGHTELGKLMADGGEKSDDATKTNKGRAALDYSEENSVNQLNSSSVFDEVPPYHASDLPLRTLPGGTSVNSTESAENDILITRQDGVKLHISLTVGSSVLEKSHMGQKPFEVIEKKTPDGSYSPEVYQHASTGTKVNIHTQERLKVDSNGLLPSIQDSLAIQDNRADIAKELKDVPAESGTDGAYPCEGSWHTFTETKVNIQSEERLKVDRNDLVSSVQGALLIQDNQKDVCAEYSTDGAYPSEVSQHAFTGTKVDIHTGETVKVDSSVLMSSVQDALLIQENQVNIAIELKDVPAESSTDGGYPSEVSQHAISGAKVNAHTQEHLKVDGSGLISSDQDILLIQDKLVNIAKELKEVPAENGTGKDTVINIEEGPNESAATQTTQNTIVSSETGDTPHTTTQLQVVEQKGTEVRDVQSVEIIKSMVYGGLIESITSLGVVSAAASGDATTLNILALGLANVIGGFFVMGHDLWELKEDHSGETTNQETGRGDRYRELLGRRQNFFIHATVAVSSFLIFGLLPPVMYGFTFRTSDNKDLKLVAAVAASLLCIIVLSSGKVYVQRPPKSYIKTVLYYVAMGFVGSGISYALGNLFKKLLEELGLFESSSIVTLPLLETESVINNPAWASY